MFLNDNSYKGSKIDHRLYIMQEVKANNFLKLKEESSKETLH